MGYIQGLARGQDCLFPPSLDELVPEDHLVRVIEVYVARLEAECRRNVEVMWLLGRLAPDFKTIADFRKDNGATFQATCRAFVQFCRQVGLIGGQLVAIDGSKFQAVAS